MQSQILLVWFWFEQKNSIAIEAREMRKNGQTITVATGSRNTNKST